MSSGYRCANDLLGYCVNPDPPTGRNLMYMDGKASYLALGACHYEPSLCDHYRTFAQVLPDLSFLDNKRPPQRQNKKPIPSYL